MISSILKEGTKNLTGLEQAIIKNIAAITELSQITRTSLGPNGMNKMVINRLGKLFVTRDSATIIRELEVVHPAAKMCVMASQQQHAESGDASNLLIVFCGELLSQAESLLRMGLHPSDIISGYEKAIAIMKDELIEQLAVNSIDDLSNIGAVTDILKTSIAPKLYGYENLFAPLVAKACVSVLPENPKLFNVDNVRVSKITGGSIDEAFLIKGCVLSGSTEGTIRTVESASIAVFQTGFDIEKTDAKNVIIIESPDELEGYNLSEEELLESKIKEIADLGVNVVVCGGTIGELSMHFFEKYNIMTIKTTSKFELRRICRATGATSQLKLDTPKEGEIGHADSIAVEEIGSNIVTIIRSEDSNLTTIVVRGATDNILDDIERAIDDGVSTFKGMTKVGNAQFLAGAGASELELANLIKKYGEHQPGQDQYAINKYAEALEIIPKTLATNAGMDAVKTLSNLYAAHSAGKANVGVDIVNKGIHDACELGVYDLLSAKLSAFRLATNAAITVLRISQIIMAKPAGVNLPRGAATSAGQMDQDPW
eukprot:TRINITY_DN36_c0_g1_i1.p1 TRINITY_DN36_c0_g1~~TRINITY_DN36_c0_g1_i1.p1  ORF type:complete len:542 (-),score=160.97 TRINITY_DN36_c0_g1_i1:95-1720(-)